MTVVAPGIPEKTRPGQFVAVAVGGEDGSMLLRRAFSVYAGQADAGSTAARSSSSSRSTARAPSGWPTSDSTTRSTWSARSVARSRCPRQPANVVLVGGGYGSAPLFSLAEALRARGCRVDFVMGASTEDKLFGCLDAKRMSPRVAFTTDDGSLRREGSGLRRPARGDRATACRRRLCVRADGDARGGAAGRAPTTACLRPGRGRGGDGLRHRGLHDLRAAGGRRRWQ